MDNTIIKFSSDLLNDNKINDIVLKINKSLNLSFDFTQYKTIYNKVFENGVKLIFFKQLNLKELIKIHNILKSNINNYNCYFINSNKYYGCIKGILFNKPCEVGYKVNNNILKIIQN